MLPIRERQHWDAKAWKWMRSLVTSPEKLDKIVYIASAILIALTVSMVINASGTQIATAPVNPLQGKTIVLDAGHGGVDAGTSGLNTRVKESDLNLEIVQNLEKMLSSRGMRVILTRSTEDALAAGKRADMDKRKEIISQPGVDLMVSVHMNSNTSHSAKGPMVYYYKNSSPGRALAEALEQSLCDVLQPEKRRGAREGDFFVLRAGDIPSALVECGFLSNSAEEKLLQDTAYQQRIVEAIVQGIANYYSYNQSEASK